MENNQQFLFRYWWYHLFIHVEFLEKIFDTSVNYNQIDWVAMGFPLAPVLANIFMGFYESKRLNEYNFNKRKVY